VFVHGRWKKIISRFYYLVWWSYYKINGTVNWHNYVYRATENRNVTEEWAVDLPRASVWILGPFFFEATVTGTAYLQCWKTTSCLASTFSILMKNVSVSMMVNNHTDGRNFVDVRFPGRWIGWRGSVEYSPRSPDLTPLEFYLWSTLNNSVCATKPTTL
jgi:hypothetical protein